LIDAFNPPHSKGSHSGNTRLIRHACGEGLEYVPLAIRAQELWDELQKETNEPIFQKTGVLSYGPQGSNFVNQGIKGGKDYNVNLEEMTGKQINERWPGHALPDDYYGFYEPDAGVLHAETCIRTFR